MPGYRTSASRRFDGSRGGVFLLALAADVVLWGGLIAVIYGLVNLLN